MQQEQKKFSISYALLGFISGLIILSWAALYFLDRNDPSEKHLYDPVVLDSLKANRIRDSLRIKFYQQEREKMLDGIMKLKVDNGYLSVELNRKEAELERATQNYTRQRQEKKIDSALSACDSIVYKYIPEYIAVDSTVLGGSSSIITAQDNLISKQDTLITDGSKYVLSVTDKVISKLESDEIQEKKDKRKERKRLISWGVVGAAIGALIATIFH